MTFSLRLFEDETARSWSPFALTRPVGELLFGTRLLRERAEAFWGRPCRGYLGRGELHGFEEEGAPPVSEPGEEVADRPLLLVSSRFVADAGADRLERVASKPGGAGATLVANDRVVGWLLPPGQPLPDPEVLARPDASPRPGAEVPVEGEVLDRPWDLVARNTERLRRDLEERLRSGPEEGWFLAENAGRLPAGVERMGDHPLFLGPGVELEPGTVLDLRNGPIALATGTRVRSFTLLEGPAFVGRGSVLLGGVLSTFSAGPVCKLRGELADSVILGYTNKAHDGHLGHAYLGRWVNLGAMTTNSDLKNNYGNVRVHTPAGPEDTGLMKVGCFLGDHVKTAIGTLVGTGAVVGAGSNLFGGEMVSRYVPPFSWGGSGGDAYALERFLSTARTAMARRGVELSPGMEAVLRRAWQRSALEREGER